MQTSGHLGADASVEFTHLAGVVSAGTTSAGGVICSLRALLGLISGITVPFATGQSFSCELSNSRSSLLVPRVLLWRERSPVL